MRSAINKSPLHGMRGRPRTFDREKALDTALKTFWEFGYEQTTMTLLTKNMKIASPSIYCAFGSKSDLFIEALTYYRQKYWDPEFINFQQSEDIYNGLHTLLLNSAVILLSPEAPCGCLTINTAVCISSKEKKIKDLVDKMRFRTKEMFQNKIADAVNSGQLASETDIEALSGALTNFFEGLAIQAITIKNIDALRKIATLGVSLLPDRK